MSIKDIYKEYDNLSIGVSLYAITSWISNRGFVGAVDTLNKSFIEIHDRENQGGNTIETYKDFKEFYKRLEGHLNNTGNYLYEDFPIDEGEVKFLSNDKFHSLLIGNGTENMYECCFLIEKLMSIINENSLKNIWSEILNYETQLTHTLYKSYYTKRESFECPPKEYFEEAQKHYNSFKNEKLHKFFENFESTNHELYSFFTSKEGLPIFLPLLKECFLEKIINTYSPEKIRFATWLLFIDKFNSQLFIKNTKELSILYPLYIDDKVIDFSFAVFEKDTVVIFISESYKEEIIRLESIIKKESFSLSGLFSNLDKNISMKIENDKNVKVAIIKDSMDTLNPNATTIISLSKHDNKIIDAISLIGIINFSDRIENISDFIDYLDFNENIQFNASGTLGLFQVWKDMNQVIDEGALNPSIAIPPYQSVWKTVEMFKGDYMDYPFIMDEIFRDIHSWKISSEQKSDLSLIKKNHSGEVEVFKYDNRNIIIHNTMSLAEEINKENINQFRSFNDIIVAGINSSKKELLKSRSYNIIKIIIVSKSLFDSYSKKFKVVDLKYLKKIIIINDKEIEVLLCLKWEVFSEYNITSKKKAFENTILIELFQDLAIDNFEDFKLQLKDSDNQSRTNMMAEIVIPYYINPTYGFTPPKETAFKAVRKIIANTILELDIKPQEYNEKDVSSLIGDFRHNIRSELISKLKNYSKVETHKKLLNEYSATLFQINIHQQRLKEFDSTINLIDDSKIEFKEQAIKLREESRVYRIVIEYAIEENLVLNERANEKIPTESEIEQLIAFAKWIIDFQTISDSNHYGAVGWNKLIVHDNYLVDIEETEKYIKDMKDLVQIRYEFGDYTERDEVLDEEFIKKAATCFELDTGVNFKVLLEVLDFLGSNSLIDNLKGDINNKIDNNIVIAPINNLINIFTDWSEYLDEDFYKVVKFITVQPDELVDKSGVLPIWEKKKRKNKLSTQPIFYADNFLIYSPVSISELKKTWFYGYINFILPYDIEMEKSINLINSWKKRYENKIVKDLAMVFGESHYDVYVDKELYKLDPKGQHPRDIGDYDLIIIDSSESKIMLFEVKYMRMSQTMKDYMGDQEKYFIGKKAKARQFERRVRYFTENKEKIVKNLGLDECYSVVSYFVSNKVIKSFFKEYPFEVISFNEIKLKFKS
ncbi:MAG TPA: hypothetical protein VK105_13480 [Virgibacillus sp.]|nr:hypothetical protein [Virgibacillus sp.]HLR68118.1 hypothetical protein [Virgibacillus sp.]